MDLKFYQLQALRTSPDDHDRVKNGCLGLIGESGEIVDIIKKHMFQSVAGTPLPVDKLIEEMGDVLWYCIEALTGIGDDVQIALTRKQTYSLFAVHTQAGVLDLETTAAMLALFAVNAYTACYFDDNIRFFRASIYDIFCTLLLLCRTINTTIDHVAMVNIEKLKQRYPNGFDPERSMNCPEYQCKETDEQATGILFNQRNKTV